jgi:hypothetical protein
MPTPRGSAANSNTRSRRATIVVAVRLPDGTEREFTIEATGLGGGRLRGLDRTVDVERTLPVSSISGIRPSDRRTRTRAATRAPALARSVDWDAMADGPLIVQSDRTVLLEVAHPDAESARHELAIFAELERAPEHIHTYRITRLGLWNARAAGHTADDMLATLDRWSRFPVPASVSIDIRETVNRYGRLVIERDDEGALVLRAPTRGARRGREEQAHPAAADRPPLPRHLRDRRLGARPHQAGAAEDRLAGGGPRRLHARHPARDRPAEDGWTLRPYQRKAVDIFSEGGSGVVVLPCGAGKTLVGAAAMADTKTTTLILVTNTVSARQWRDELLKRTSLTPEEIGEYSGQAKEVKPVTIATYQILTAKRKGQYAHLALLDALDWGLIVYDEVHLLPAPVFKLTADLQARRRLGLTATLVREDGREGDVFSLIGPKRFDAPWKEIEAQGFISPPSATRCASTSRRPTAWSTRPPPTTSATVSPPRRTRRSAWSRTSSRARGRADPRDRPVPRPDRRAVRGAGRTEDHGRDARRRARGAVRRVPRGAPAGARGLEGRELLDRSARGLGRDPGVGIVRLAAGGGAAARPTAASQVERAHGELLHAHRPRHGRPGLRAEPAALPRRAGLQLHDPGRRGLAAA